MIDHANVKLGKQPTRFDKRTLKLAKYLTPGLPAPPPLVDWSAGISEWGIMKNDSLGDCTCAAVGHLVMLWTANTIGAPKVISDADIVRAYSAVSGYDSRTGRNDDGANELDVLNYWSNTGVGGDRLSAYAAVDVTNLQAVYQSIYLFGGVYIGVQLPTSSQGKDIWDYDRSSTRPGSWGGHAIPIVSYNQADGTFQVITWGGLLTMTMAFYKACCDEMYAPLSQDWIANSQAPNCLDLTMLTADLQEVKS